MPSSAWIGSALLDAICEVVLNHRSGQMDSVSPRQARPRSEICGLRAKSEELRYDKLETSS